MSTVTTSKNQYVKQLRKTVFERFTTAFFRAPRNVQRIWLAIILSGLPTRELEGLLRRFEEYGSKEPKQ